MTAWAAEQKKVSLNLRDASLIEGISPSPRESKIAAYKVGLEEEGETATGDGMLIDLAGSRPTVRMLKLPGELLDGTRPVWTKDGNSLYILSDRIYRVSAEGSVLESLPVEASAGLALSPSELRLAFWRFEEPNELSLIVYDLRERREIHKWALPYRYGTEPYGFEIAFDGENRIYARTFDEGLDASKDPLKVFDLASGEVRKVAERCSSLMRTGTSIYFITYESGWKHFQLRQITRNASTPKVLMPAFGFQGLATTGKERWLAVGSRHKGGLLGTSKNRIVNEVHGCDSVTMLADGRVIYIRKGLFSSDPGICAQRK